ncbi:hypothetical protein CEXT_38891 [Caerostris extrusa]|uniref:Uncharacterized protein n=1 Tax=Caerostris extrusa TaxID=172846 RepID=A0AAV4P2H0_CAEEX|nr:hypothetical protein CEXT_38891 [Caerostris extrusa]
MAIYRNPSNHLRSQELPRSACDGGPGVPLPILDPLPRPFPNPRRKATEFLPLSLLTRSLGYKARGSSRKRLSLTHTDWRRPLKTASSSRILFANHYISNRIEEKRKVEKVVPSDHT